jgi:hypothetical protein
MTYKILKQIALTASSAVLLTLARPVTTVASTLYQFNLLDNFNLNSGKGSFALEDLPQLVEQSGTLEKFKVSDFHATVWGDNLEHPFSDSNAALALFDRGEFLGVQYSGPSSTGYFLLLDGGDEAVKPGEPGAWSLWRPNPTPPPIFVKATGGATVQYTAVPESNNIAAIYLFALLAIASKAKRIVSTLS